MRIARESCIGCGECQPYCPLEAIEQKEMEGKTKSWVKGDESVMGDGLK